MACNPSSLLASANCIEDCLTSGQMDAINSSLLCGIANSTGNFVLRAGDTMTGNLLLGEGISIRSGLTASSDILGFAFQDIVSFFGSSGTCEVLCRYSNDSSGPSILGLKTRSTTDTTANVIVVAGDIPLFLEGIGADGVSYRRGARFQLRVDTGVVTGLNDMPGRIEFQSTPDGTSSLSTYWIIDSAGLFSSINAGNMSINNATSIPAGGTAGIGYMFSSTANFGMFFGSGIPALSAAQGSWYSRSDGSGTTDRAYINIDGAVGWTAVTTVA